MTNDELQLHICCLTAADLNHIAADCANNYLVQITWEINIGTRIKCPNSNI